MCSPRLRIASSRVLWWLSIPAGLWLVGCGAPLETGGPGEPTEQNGYPLFDGRCDEYEALGATPRELPHRVVLWAFQDSSYVWLCLALPDDSLGTFDLTLDAPALAETLNLHVSAQIGEWRSAHPEEAPQDPASPRWGQVAGWFGNVVDVQYDGFDYRDDGRPWYRFAPSAARELQLSKERFGRGTWTMRFEMRAIRDGEGARQSFVFPAQDREAWAFEVD